MNYCRKMNLVREKKTQLYLIVNKHRAFNVSRIKTQAYIHTIVITRKHAHDRVHINYYKLFQIVLESSGQRNEALD